jgi:hypothetical protein
MSEERKLYVPLKGKYVKAADYQFTTRWYEEQGIELPPDKSWRSLACWLYRAGIEFNRKERYLRLWRLSVSWDWQ